MHFPRTGGLAALALLMGLGCARICNAEVDFGEVLDVPYYGAPYYTARQPRAATEIMGAWDRWGYPDLIPGSAVWWLNSSAITNAVVSPGHITDYAEYGGSQDGPGAIILDLSSLNPSAAHPDDSMADFMKTSQSTLNLAYGFTDPLQIAPGIVDYANYRGYGFTATRQAANWTTLVHEIDFGRPVLLDNGYTAVGYRVEDGYYEIEYHYVDPWTKEPREDWDEWNPILYQFVLIRPSGTLVETAFTNSNSDWSSAAAWNNGVPTSAAYVHVPFERTANITASALAKMVVLRGGLNISSTVDVNALRIFGLAEQTAGQVNVGSSLTVADHNAIFEPRVQGRYRLSGGEVNISDRLFTRAGGRFEWWGGTLNVPLVEVDGGEFAFGMSGQVGGAGGLNITAVKSGVVEVSRGAHITQAAETRTLDYLSIGADPYGGSWTHPAGATLISSGIDVGVSGPGSFHQQGGAVTASGLPGYDIGGVTLGVLFGGQGTYQMDDGTLDTARIYVGRRSIGTFIQNDGIINSGEKVFVGSGEGGIGSYEMYGGELNTDFVHIFGNSSFTQGGGTFNIEDPHGSDLRIGGFYYMNGGQLNVRNQSFSIGSAALFRQTGGTVDADAIEVFGGDPVPYGGYELLNGTLKITYGLSVGASPSQDGEFVQSGGSVTADQYMIRNGIATQTGGSVDARVLLIGRSEGNVAKFEVSGGTIEFDEAHIGEVGGSAGLRELKLSGPVSMTASQLTVANLFDNAAASLIVTHPGAQIHIRDEIVLGRNAVIDALLGNTIHMDGAHFRNGSITPASLADLSNVTLLFDGGPSLTATIEVASPVPSNPQNPPNGDFRIGSIVLGSQSSVGRLRLVNNYDNHLNNSVAEALHVGDLTVNAGSTLLLNGFNLYYDSLSLGAGAVLNAPNSSFNVGDGKILSGAGTVMANVNVGAGGIILPGSSPGILSIQGTYQQAAGSTLGIEIGGTIPGTQYDRLAITGSATLDGTLDIDLVNGFRPADQDIFQILTFASRTGEFDTITGSYLGGGLFFDLLYNSTDLTLLALQAGPGDADLDGDADLSDLGRLAGSYGLLAGADWMQGDFDHDGDVDLTDLGTLAGNYEEGAQQAMADFGLLRSSVPEPNSLTLLCLALIGYRRKRLVGRRQ